MQCSVTRAQRHDQRAFVVAQVVAGDIFPRQVRMRRSRPPSGGPYADRALLGFGLASGGLFSALYPSGDVLPIYGITRDPCQRPPDV